MADQKKPHLLLVEDDNGLQKQLAWAFDDFEVSRASDRASAQAVLDQERPSVVLLDLGLPPDADGPSEGLATLRAVLQASPESKVIMMSGQTDREFALKAVALGAYDFYQKPIAIDEIRLIVSRAQRLFELEQENHRLAQGQAGTPLPGVLTSNPQMLEVCRDIAGLAATTVSVLIYGESGTGKELIAQALHQFSPRAKGPFVAVNCAAIPENLLESEFFGHEKGAFTGAIKTTVGKVELANKGTLFLDEIGDMPMPLQAKLLRAIQEREIDRVGGGQPIKVNIRLLATSNRNLEEAVANGSFREDLFFRMNVVNIQLPALRERPQDIPILAQHFAAKYSEANGLARLEVTPAALEILLAHHWRGNVRELENIIERAVTLSPGDLLDVDDLRLEPTAPAGAAQAPMNSAGMAPQAGVSGLLTPQLEDVERQAIREALEQTRYNKTAAAKLLGLTFRQLRYRIKKLGIE